MPAPYLLVWITPYHTALPILSFWKCWPLGSVFERQVGRQQTAGTFLITIETLLGNLQTQSSLQSHAEKFAENPVSKSSNTIDIAMGAI